jgi:hypothetical protein
MLSIAPPQQQCGARASALACAWETLFSLGNIQRFSEQMHQQTHL